MKLEDVLAKIFLVMISLVLGLVFMFIFIIIFCSAISWVILGRIRIVEDLPFIIRLSIVTGIICSYLYYSVLKDLEVFQ